ncbi:MAG: glycerol-3-phosphate acyltransferase [Fidelibacterota bacterium]|nr:MAG: glycerol-3-phosphate acyltransferase [Candidatus Neomarinimicrobiota bacterium]
MDDVLKGALTIAIGYLLGSLLPAYFLAKVKGFDIRERGSGNPGISNVADTMGYGAAVLVAVYDLAKAPLAILVATQLGNSMTVSYAAGFAAYLGHRAPFYLHFRGGEGLATIIAIGFYAIGRLVLLDNRYAYALVPILAIMAVIFLLFLEQKPAVPLVLIFVPLLVNSALLFTGINIHSIILLLVGLYIIGHRLYKLLNKHTKHMITEERKLLWRKWLRPLAIVFPLGTFLFKTYTILVLLTVFLAFVILEIIRFQKKYNRFPVPYRKTEESRISSMVIFLFASLLVLWFFPTNIATLAILFVVFGDLLAWCVGITVGGKGFLGKTWSGTLACLVTCLTLAIVYHTLGLVALPVGMLGALSATAVEVAPLHEDNFVMPVVSVIVMAII